MYKHPDFNVCHTSSITTRAFKDLPVVFDTEGQEIGVAGCVHGGDQHVPDLLGLALLSFNQVIPVVPGASGFVLLQSMHMSIHQHRQCTNVD